MELAIFAIGKQFKCAVSRKRRTSSGERYLLQKSSPETYEYGMVIMFVGNQIKIYKFPKKERERKGKKGFITNLSAVRLQV
jgi:hypothetical protein